MFPAYTESDIYVYICRIILWQHGDIVYEVEERLKNNKKDNWNIKNKDCIWDFTFFQNEMPFSLWKESLNSDPQLAVIIITPCQLSTITPMSTKLIATSRLNSMNIKKKYNTTYDVENPVPGTDRHNNAAGLNR